MPLSSLHRPHLVLACALALPQPVGNFNCNVCHMDFHTVTPFFTSKHERIKTQNAAKKNKKSTSTSVPHPRSSEGSVKMEMVISTEHTQVVPAMRKPTQLSVSWVWPIG